MTRNAWSKEDINFLYKNYPTKGAIYCADAIGKTRESVSSKASRLSIKNIVSPNTGTKRPKISIAHKKSHELGLLKGVFKPIHGMRKHPLYYVWRNMLGRCENPNRKDYKYYGGRGISVCERWHDIHYFLFDIGPRPSTLHSIDRIDNNGNYEPNNCKWSTHTEQMRNRRAW